MQARSSCGGHSSGARRLDRWCYRERWQAQARHGEEWRSNEIRNGERWAGSQVGRNRAMAMAAMGDMRQRMIVGVLMVDLRRYGRSVADWGGNLRFSGREVQPTPQHGQGDEKMDRAAHRRCLRHGSATA